jgi:hypothetical protein
MAKMFGLPPTLLCVTLRQLAAIEVAAGRVTETKRLQPADRLATQ